MCVWDRAICGEQGTRNREQRPENRDQRTETRDQRSENREQRTENREQRTENREQRTENREQRTENREQRTENREQRTENREQRTEGPLWCPGSLGLHEAAADEDKSQLGGQLADALAIAAEGAVDGIGAVGVRDGDVNETDGLGVGG